jgi:hypothetical protein
MVVRALVVHEPGYSEKTLSNNRIKRLGKRALFYSITRLIIASRFSLVCNKLSLQATVYTEGKDVICAVDLGFTDG